MRIVPQLLVLSSVFCLALASLAAQPFAGRVDLGTISAAEIDEASGLCASHMRSDIFWTHNDSGDKGRIFAIDSAARLIATYYLQNIENRDWEDICAGEIDGTSYLFVAEIGDNNAAFARKMIYKVAEPRITVGLSGIVDTIRSVETISYEYPDGNRDAESLMFDSRTKDLYVISKREDSVHVYRLPFPQATSGLTAIELVAVLPYTYIVAADISPDGSEILFKGYYNVYYVSRASTQSVADALKGAAQQQPYEMEPQGEALCFDLNGRGYYTTSEMSPNAIPPHLYFYPRLSSAVASDSLQSAPVTIDSVRVDMEAKSMALWFHSKGDRALTVQLFDMRGRSVLATPHMSYRDGANEIRLPVSGLRSGQYVVRILGNGCVCSKLLQIAN